MDSPVKSAYQASSELCGNCHSTHFSKAKGLLAGDEKSVCLGCHGADGLGVPPLRNIKKELEGKKVLHGPIQKNTCGGCHDPHGTPNYRNVLTSPAGGTGVTVEMAKDVFRDQPPGDPPSTAGAIAAYRRSNEGYKAQTSKWCVECHDQLKPNVGPKLL